MSRVELHPFDDDHCEAAGALLAARHIRHREAQPLLDARYEDPAVCASEVRRVFKSEGASGSVALSQGEMVGYLIGAARSAAWGPNVWVEVAGHAAADAETTRDLYAFAAQGWVDRGMTAHYAIVPANDAATSDAWFSVSFGLQHVHAVRELDGFVSGAPPSGVTVHRASRADVRTLAEMDLVLPEHLARSPVFSSGKKSTVAEAAAEWEKSIDDPDFAAFLVEREGLCLGSSVGCAVEKSSAHSGLARPADAGMLGYAAVRPEVRDRGLGRVLTGAVVEWALERGNRCLVIDWRSTNLPASRTWPRFGFRPTFLRLHRNI